MDELLKHEFSRLGEHSAISHNYLVKLIATSQDPYSNESNVELQEKLIEDLVRNKRLRKVKVTDGFYYLMLKEQPDELANLKKENKRLLDILGVTDIKEEEVMYEEYIKRLHQYNELKDTVQMLMGRLAVLENCTTKDLYPEFDLSPKD